MGFFKTIKQDFYGITWKEVQFIRAVLRNKRYRKATIIELYDCEANRYMVSVSMKPVKMGMFLEQLNDGEHFKVEFKNGKINIYKRKK